MVVSEGQTEEAFIRQLVAPTLAERVGLRDAPTAPDLPPGPGWRTNSKDRVLHHLPRILKERDDVYVSTFFDLYGLAPDFPGLSEALGVPDPIQRAASIEAAFGDAVVEIAGCRPAQFVPHIQPHEFEALLFADVSAFATVQSTWHGHLPQLAMNPRTVSYAGAHQRWSDDASVRTIGALAAKVQQTDGWPGHRGEHRPAAHACRVPPFRPMARSNGGVAATPPQRFAMTIVTESLVEDAALDWYRGLGYQVLAGTDVAPLPGAFRGELRGCRPSLVATECARKVESFHSPGRPPRRRAQAPSPVGCDVGGSQPQRPPHASGRCHGRVSGRGRGTFEERRFAYSTSTNPNRTTGSSSTSSPFRRTSTRAARTSSSSSTACRSRSSN